MYPPIFSVCSVVSAVTALIGTSPVRLYPFGEAPQGVALPYVAWQIIGGSPENFINEAPDADTFSIQIDAYAATADSARAVAAAIRDAIQSRAHVVSWNGETRDPDTKNYRYSFSVDWMVQR